MNIIDAIRDEAIECEKSSEDMRNTDDNRRIFLVVSIILKCIANRLEQPNEEPEATIKFKIVEPFIEVGK